MAAQRDGEKEKGAEKSGQQVRSARTVAITDVAVAGLRPRHNK